MPQPLSEDNKEALRTSYVQGYAALGLGIVRTRPDATEAVKNVKKKFEGKINVSCDDLCVPLVNCHCHCDDLPFVFYGFKPHSTGCIHEALPEHDSCSESRIRPAEANQNPGMCGLLLLFLM